jgi:hypothetical protein
MSDKLTRIAIVNSDKVSLICFTAPCPLSLASLFGESANFSSPHNDASFEASTSRLDAIGHKTQFIVFSKGSFVYFLWHGAT